MSDDDRDRLQWEANQPKVFKVFAVVGALVLGWFIMVALFAK